MEITLDTTSIEGSITELERLRHTAQDTASAAQQSTLNGSFSGVSGLDQLGSGHGAVLLGGPGSAGDVLNSYAEQIQWLGEALTASYLALTGQNSYVGRGMDIADEGGAAGTEGVSFPQRPRPRFENFSFTPPVVLPAMSIDQLAMEFSTTNIGASTQAAATWQQLSTSIAQVAAGLHAVAVRLVAENSGEVITAAAGKIAAVAAAGDTFAVNAAVMTTSVQQLAAIKSQGAVQVNLARSALATIVEPVEKIAAERAFLAAFPASFSPSVISGVPPIRNLMSLDGSTGGGGEIALGMDNIAGEGAVQTGGLAPAGVGAGGPVGGGAETGGTQFRSVDSGLEQLSRVGHNAAEVDTFGRVDALGTTSAGLGSPFTATPTALSGLSGALHTPATPTSIPGINAALGMAPVGAPRSAGGLGGPGVAGGGSGFGGARGHGGGIGGPGVPSPALRGGVPALTSPAFPSRALSGGQLGPGRAPGVLPATGSPTGGNLSLPPSPGGVGGGSGTGGAPGVPVGGMGAPMMGGAGASGSNATRGGGSAARSGPPGVPGAPGASQLKGGPGAGGISAGGGAGTGGGGRVGMPGGVGLGEPPAARALAGTGVGGGAGAPGATGGSSQLPKASGGMSGRGMMPMMGAPAGGAQAGPGKTAKVKTVTSVVEEEGNIAALLGERGPVVPGVIGDWVRT